MIGVSVLLTVVIVTSLWLYFSRHQEKEKKIPGLKPTTEQDGNLADIRAAGGFQNFLQNLHAQLGPIVSFWYGRVYTVSIASPELFKQHMQPFDRPPLFFKFFEPLFGPASIQFANGEDGRCRRKMYDRAFGHDKFSQYCNIFQRSADVTIEQWSAKEEDVVISLGDETFKFAVRSALCSTLGEYCEDEDVISDFRKAYLKAQSELSKVLGDPTHCEKAQTMQHFNEVLSFGLYYLGKHENVQEKLYNEIMEVLGDDGIVDESNFGDLKYMRQVIDESIRCGTFGVFAARYQEIDITLGGFKVSKNTPVIQALGALMMDENVWPMPTEFDPERFNKENTKKRNPFAFKPFGFSGKRICPGYKFVHPKSTVFLATVLRRFKIKLHGEQEVEVEHGLATHSTEEMWAKLVSR